MHATRTRRFAAAAALALGMLGIAGGSVAASGAAQAATVKPFVYMHA
jgi:hypothetical protein